MGTDEQIIDALDGFDPADHEAEAQERWGDSDAWRASSARTKRYTPDQWREIRAEADEITDRFGELHAGGADPAAALALDAAEDWRAHLARWYYDASPDLLRGLGDLYAADPRFALYYDGADGEREGLALWVRDALAAFADSHD
jgi:hypothetical protein